MNRREFLTGLSAAGAYLASARPLATLGDDSGTIARKPNILVLLTDDQRWDAMGCMGNPVVKTPNMDRLAREGFLFENAFVTTPICGASRASIFLGQYERRHGFTFGKNKIISQSAWERSYPWLLKQAGYRTGFIGKFGVKADWKKMGGPQGTFDVYQPGGGQYFPKSAKENATGENKHLTQIIGEQAIEFLRGCSKDQPFCLSISFKAPHVQDKDPRQFLYDPAYKDLYKDAAIPVPKTADPRYFESLPKFVQESEGRKRWGRRFATPELYQEMVKGYYRLVTGVDVVIGRIFNELNELKLNENTVILYLSDNGFFLGEHGLAGKWLMYEESIRVPLLIYDPRMPPAQRGKRVAEMALNLDLPPTILDLAGVKIPDTVQGTSLLPLMRGTAPDWRKDFLCEHLWKVTFIPQSEGVRTEQWKYFRYFAQNPVCEELYDLQNDHLEENNLAGDKDHEAVLQSLRKRCDELKTQWSR